MNILQAFEKIKRVQVRKFHLSKSSAKQDNILTNPLEIFHLAVQNSKPVLDITPVKRGGVTYKVTYLQVVGEGKTLKYLHSLSDFSFLQTTFLSSSL